MVDHSHLLDFPEALATLFSRLGELKLVLGPAAAPGVDQVEADLRGALAARERGDVPAAVERIGKAMDRLAGLASDRGPAPGAPQRGARAAFRPAPGRRAARQA